MLRSHGRTLIGIWLLLTGLLAPAIMAPLAQAADERDCNCREYEDEVLVDARGDANIEWPGSVDLFYLSVGEVFSGEIRENHIFFRFGMNITAPGDETVENDVDDAIPETPPPAPPRGRVLPGDNPVILLRLQFKTDDMPEDSPGYVENGTYIVDIETGDYGETWRSNQGRFAIYSDDVNDHGELVFMTSLRRLELETHDRLFDFQVDAYRIEGEQSSRTDSMDGFDLAPDATPGDAEPRGIRQGIPTGIPQPDDLIEHAQQVDPNRRDTWVPDGIDHERALDDEGRSDVRRGEHFVQDGRDRIRVRAYQESTEGKRYQVAWANFSIENTFDELPQTVTMLAAISPSEGWLFRYGPDTTGGRKTIGPGESAKFAVVALPLDWSSTPIVSMTAIFVSDYGGIQFREVAFVNGNERILPDRDLQQTASEPVRLVVTFMNEFDPHRVNEPRLLMFQVTDDFGRPVVGFKEAAVFVWKYGTPKPSEPHPLTEKPFMDGVYETPYTFHSPGAWHVDIRFYDYPAMADGNFPGIEFDVRVDYNDEGSAVVPMPLAIGGLGLGLTGLVVREKLQKQR